MKSRIPGDVGRPSRLPGGTGAVRSDLFHGRHGGRPSIQIVRCSRLALAALLVATAPGFAQSPSPSPESKPVKFVPTVAKVAESEGNTAFMRKDYAGARKAYQKVLDLVPDNVLGLTNLGVVEFSSGNTAKAEELLKKAVSIRLQNPAAWLTLGIIYMDQEHFDEALAALAQAVLQDPRNPRARNYLGVVIGRKGAEILFERPRGHPAHRGNQEQRRGDDREPDEGQDGQEQGGGPVHGGRVRHHV